MKNNLSDTLKKLRLSGLSSTLEIRLHEARSNHLSHEEFLELILQDELNLRGDRAFARRFKNANFRDRRTLEDFDFSFNPEIKRSQIMELATCQFIRQPADILFIGPPGVGKSHLAQALGYQATRTGYLTLYRSIFDLASELMQAETLHEKRKMLNRYLKVDLLIIDDMGLKHLPNQAGEYLLEIIVRRHELKSTIMTSNRPLEEWGQLIGDIPTATAVLDRFLSRAITIPITGRSYRMKNIACKNTQEKTKNES